MADENNMFSAYGSIFDAASADNVTVRDRALNVAQLQPGRATVYGATEAGGMMMQNLASMAGMKTAEQEKAETITSIMKESQNLDPNDPQSARLLAQKFIEAGLPGIGQKFMERARTIDVKNQELVLSGREVTAKERQVDIMAATEERAGSEFQQELAIKKEYLEMDWGKFEHTKFQDTAYLDIATNADTRDQAKFEYQQKQDEILNALRNKEIDITEANQKLQANMFAFDQIRAKVGDEQWAAEFDEQQLNNASTRAYQLANTDNLILENEAFTYNNNIKNANLEAQTASLEIDTKLKERGLSMPPEGEFITVDDRLQRYNPDTNSYDDITDPALLETGEYGLSVEEGRVYDNIWDQYKQRFFEGSDILGGGQWAEDTPDFLDWARKNITGEQGLAIIEKGQGGTRGSYNDKLMTDFNNSQTTDGSQVAATVTTVVDGVERQDVVTEPVNIDFLSSEFKVNKNEFSKVPPKVDGKKNNLTNGQIITKLMMEGKEGEAAEFASKMEGQKVETTSREQSIDATSENKWTKIKISDSRYQGKTRMNAAQERGEVKKIGGEWYTNK